MKHLVSLTGLLLMMTLQGRAELVTDVQTLLERMPQQHPRLILPTDEAAWKASISASPKLRAVAAYVVQGADSCLDAPLIERELEGRRMLTVSRIALKRILLLGMAWRLEANPRHARRAIDEMLATTAFIDWNPSHFLDVAEMSTALAIGYDWFFEAMTEEERTTIRQALIEKGLQPSFPEKEPWWVDRDNNWNQVCHGGLVLAALVVAEQEPELAARTIVRAVEHLPTVLKQYAPDGVYPEGPSYWKYGTTYNVIMINAIESALGTSFGLADAPGFLPSAEFYLHVEGPTGEFFNFSDGGSKSEGAPAMFWMAGREARPGLLFHEWRKLPALIATPPEIDRRSHRFLPLLLAWAKPTGAIETPKTLHWHGDGPVPVAMHRTGWEKDATFVAIKGGSPGASHGHMDIGSFVLDMGGERWATDLGAQSYHSLEKLGMHIWDRKQKGDRWRVFRLNNFSHSTLVVDGQLQVVDSFSPITESTATRTVVDMTKAYGGQLEEAVRTVQLVGEGEVRFTDKVRATDEDRTVRWAMLTSAEVAIESPQRAVLTRNGKSVVLELGAPSNAQWQLYEAAKPPGEWDAPNPGHFLVGFEFDVDADQEVEVSVTATLQE